MKPYPLLLALLLISAAPLPQVGNEVVTKTYCTQAIGYTDLEKLKTDLLTGAKRLAVNELFGELIASSTAVKDFVVTSDEIKASSIGFVRLDGNVNYSNGKNLAEVCVTIRGYATPQDREQFKPTKVAKRNCISDPTLTNRELKAKAQEEVIIKALEDFDPELVGQDRKKVLRLMQRVQYLESGLVPDTDTYCARIEGEVMPIEVKALLELDSITNGAAPDAENSGTATAEENASPISATTPITFALPFTDGFDTNYRPEWNFLAGSPEIRDARLTGLGDILVIEIGDPSLTDYAVSFDYFDKSGEMFVNLGPIWRLRISRYVNGNSGCSWQVFRDNEWTDIVSKTRCLPKRQGQLIVTAEGDMFKLLDNGIVVLEANQPDIKERGPVQISLTVKPIKTSIDNFGLSMP